MKTGFNPADNNQFRSHTGKKDFIPFVKISKMKYCFSSPYIKMLITSPVFQQIYLTKIGIIKKAKI